MDYRGRVNAGSVARLLIEERDGLRPREIGVASAEHSGRDGRELVVDDYRGRFGGARGRGVFGIVDEGELSGLRVLDAGDAGDFGVGRSVVEARVDGGSDVG